MSLTDIITFFFNFAKFLEVTFTHSLKFPFTAIRKYWLLDI